MSKRATNEMEELLEEFVQSVLADVEALPEAPVPFGEVPLSDDEQLERYLGVRDDVGYWRRLIEERGLDAAVDYFEHMERRLRDAGADAIANA